MTKLQELNKEYKQLEGKKLCCIILFVNMPTGEIETITNPRVKEKIEYINKTYNDDLVHCNCKDIYIKEYLIVEDENKYTFGDALENVKSGKGMRLPNWQKDVVVRAQFPDENSKMTAPYLYVESRFGRVPWKETMIELFADNWEIVE